MLVRFEISAAISRKSFIQKFGTHAKSFGEKYCFILFAKSATLSKVKVII